MVRTLAAGVAAALLCAGCALSGTGRALRAAPTAQAPVDDSTGASALDPEGTAEDHALAQEVQAAGGTGGSAHGEVRLSGDGFPAGEARRNETYAALMHPRLRLAFRRKAVGESAPSSFNVRAEPVAGAVALHAGSFTPDLGGGLVAGGASVRPLSSNGFPFAEPRRFTANTGSYGRAVIGGAAEVAAGRFRAAAFAGRERFSRTGGVRLARRCTVGGRVEARTGRVRSGLTVASGPGEPGGLRAAVDARIDRDGLRAGVQAAYARKAPPAAMAALSIRREGFSAACLFHAVPAGLAGPFGRINGRDIRSSAAFSGAALVMERRLPRRARIRASAERTERSEGTERSIRRLLRVDLEKRWRSLRLAASWSSVLEWKIPLAPLPAEAPSEEEGSASFGLVASTRAARGASIRIAVKNVAGSSGARGLLFSPMLRAVSRSGRMRLIAGCTAYRVEGGRTACYYYEPSLAGAYPWRYAAGGTGRAFIITTINSKVLRVSYKVVFESRRRAAGAFEASASF